MLWRMSPAHLPEKHPAAKLGLGLCDGAMIVQNLACAQRPGLCGGEDLLFGTRAEFVGAIQAGGVAAMSAWEPSVPMCIVVRIQGRTRVWFK